MFHVHVLFASSRRHLHLLMCFFFCVVSMVSNSNAFLMVPSSSASSSPGFAAPALDEQDLASEDLRRSQIKADITRHRSILKGLKLELHLLDAADLELFSQEASSDPLLSVFRSLSPSNFLMAYEIGRRLLVFWVLPLCRFCDTCP